MHNAEILPATSPAYLNTGGRYNPSTNIWTATSTTNAPSARSGHTAVWSGSETIVWGGVDASSNCLNTGGRYNPLTDIWTVTSTTNAPDARFVHTAVWSGSQMIVWGGVDASSNYLNTGGRYCAHNPCTTAEQLLYPASNLVPLDHRLSIRKRAPHSPQQLIINLTFDQDATFLAADLSQTDIGSMKIACDYAQSVVASNFSDPINVNIFVTAVPGTCLKGQSSPNFEPAYTYTGFLSNLVSDETSDDDRAALGPGGSIPMADPIGGSHGYILTKAQAKALNLVPQIDGTLDGTFTFGGGWQWTYDPLHRAVPCKSDFIGAAMHEFTEIMGRIGLMGTIPALPQSYALMDLFSYRSLNVRGLDNGPGRFFSIDNGTTLLKLFNDTFHYGGDLQDWAAGTTPTPTPAPGDLFDARIVPGIQYDLTAVDLRVMDVIGYDRVTGTPTPTPTTTPTLTPTPTPCMGRCAPTPRPRPTPAPRPTPH